MKVWISIGEEPDLKFVDQLADLVLVQQAVSVQRPGWCIQRECSLKSSLGSGSGSKMEVTELLTSSTAHCMTGRMKQKGGDQPVEQGNRETAGRCTTARKKMVMSWMPVM